MLKRSFIIILCLVIGGLLFADIPQKINYQGRLLENGSPVNGTKTMRFYVNNGSSDLWDSGDKSVGVSNGIYNVELSIDPGVFMDTNQLYLRISVGGQMLSPDVVLLAVPYAYRSVTANNISDIAITEETVGSSDNIVFNY